MVVNSARAEFKHVFCSVFSTSARSRFSAFSAATSWLMAANVAIWSCHVCSVCAATLSEVWVVVCKPD